MRLLLKIFGVPASRQTEPGHRSAWADFSLPKKYRKSIRIFCFSQLKRCFHFVVFCVLKNRILVFVRKEAEKVQKILVDVPKSMTDFCRSNEAKQKPYDICLQCPYIRESCDGPNILAMEYPRWAEWAKERIKMIGLTRAAIAEKTGIPLSTVNNALSGASYDIRTDTMRRITKIIIGGCWGQYPCHFAALLMEGVDLEDNEDGKKISELQAEIEQLKAELKKATEGTEARIQEVKREAQTKVDYLKEQVNIRDKYLAEKNQMINDLMAAVIGKKE